ncbi:hypothetical protein niasHT_022528 [Heterodera trifolii]|uniref:Uncharacterized protein n=1 Tax=Heterodera trifolii TaxID=157864 RepID=A0ABD2JR63_9BILA
MAILNLLNSLPLVLHPPSKSECSTTVHQPNTAHFRQHVSASTDNFIRALFRCTVILKSGQMSPEGRGEGRQRGEGRRGRTSRWQAKGGEDEAIIV